MLKIIKDTTVMCSLMLLPLAGCVASYSDGWPLFILVSLIAILIISIYYLMNVIDNCLYSSEKYINILKKELKDDQELIDAGAEYAWTHNIVDRRLWPPLLAKATKQRVAKKWEEYYAKIGQLTFQWEENNGNG